MSVRISTPHSWLSFLLLEGCAVACDPLVGVAGIGVLWELREHMNLGRPLSLGRVVATPGALKVLTEAGEDLRLLLKRHRSGDWGDLDVHDRRENERSLRHGRRVLSSYPVGGKSIWVITEADRSVTTVLLPEEY